MSVSAADVVFRKSETVTDTGANGGRKGQTEVISGGRHNMFPRVSRAERVAGVTRYRKEFWCNDNADDDIAHDVLIFLESPSNGGDRFAIGKGGQIDAQADLALGAPAWFGAGSLNSALSGGETAVELLMEGDDFEFPNGGKLHLTDKFSTGQTIASDVRIGDSVELITGTWERIAATDDIAYPKGLYVGSDTVMTVQPASSEEWLAIADNLYTDEDIGDGDGASLTPSLTTLAHNTAGICLQDGLLPVIKATCGAVERTVNVAADGACTGYCTAGQLNMTTGAWTTPITWTTAPDTATDILATYRENCFAYSGNVATITLTDQVANSYLTANTYGSGCILESEVTPAASDWVESSALGTYDESSHPLALNNDGAERDTWTITFTSASAFTCAGASEGNVGSGVITSDFAPINPNTGQPYFTLDKDGWAGTWASGETITFVTSPAALPVWCREIVPPGTAKEDDNLFVMGWYCE